MIEENKIIPMDSNEIKSIDDISLNNLPVSFEKEKTGFDLNIEINVSTIANLNTPISFNIFKQEFPYTEFGMPIPTIQRLTHGLGCDNSVAPGCTDSNDGNCCSQIVSGCLTLNKTIPGIGQAECETLAPNKGCQNSFDYCKTDVLCNSNVCRTKAACINDFTTNKKKNCIKEDPTKGKSNLNLICQQISLNLRCDYQTLQCGNNDTGSLVYYNCNNI